VARAGAPRNDISEEAGLSTIRVGGPKGGSAVVTENLERILTAHPFFSGMRPEQLQLLVGCASNTRFEPGQFMLHEGQEANEFYLVRQGKVALEVHCPGRGSINIQTLGEGDIVGWSWLVPPYNWRFDARAVEPTRAIALDGKCLREKCERDYELGYELLKRFTQVVVECLESAQIQLQVVYGDPANATKDSYAA
jgi:CRP/FNR family cyclic AMP-dependent transcriptional regulator